MLRFVWKVETHQFLRLVHGFHWTCPAWMWHRQTDQELLSTMLVGMSVCTPKQANAATQYATLTLQRQISVSTTRNSPPGVSLNSNADTSSFCLCWTAHLTNGHERRYTYPLPSTWTYILIWDAVALCILLGSPEHANCRMFLLFYALTRYMSATVCNLTAAVRYIVATLHYACHIVD